MDVKKDVKNWEKCDIWYGSEGNLLFNGYIFWIG